MESVETKEKIKGSIINGAVVDELRICSSTIEYVIRDIQNAKYKIFLPRGLKAFQYVPRQIPEASEPSKRPILRK
jgi:hypothetical protein